MDQPATTNEQIVDSAVAEGGAYEVIRQRLLDQGRQLHEQSTQLNELRVQEFGASEMRVTARIRVRTENNCVARDIVQVGDLILFGYNVFIGLKKETRVDDVFALFSEQQTDEGYELKPAPIAGSFLDQSSFRNDFDELYRYYKHTRLAQLVVRDDKLLAGFQIGERLEDIRVFRWTLSADRKTVTYLDNRGERDIALPPRFDFEWTATTREDMVEGRHPHVNILDQIFVQTLDGSLTVKVEDNTEDGLGIFREAVEDNTQSLADAEFQYAKVGTLILLRVLPYREEQWRFLVFNTLNQSVHRFDAIGQSCVQLPEDHGIIFPGGYYLSSGEHKTFDRSADDLQYKRTIRSPNGEDVLFVFYDPNEGRVGLFGYNMINKSLHNPLIGHGYALSEIGRVILFVSENEPTRIHPMEIWETPYVSDEFASRQPPSQNFLGRAGNAALVRGISDLFTVCRMIDNQSVSARLYEELSASARKMFDAHYWLDAAETASIHALLTQVVDTSELVVDEFEKVNSIRQDSAKAMQDAQAAQQELLRVIQYEEMDSAEHYVRALSKLRHQRGHLTTTREYRYIDVVKIDALSEEIVAAENQLTERTVEFLSAADALAPYLAKIEGLSTQIRKVTTVAELTPHLEVLDETAAGLDLLMELMATLKVSDATLRTRIIDAISDVYGAVNQAKALGRNTRNSLGSVEAVAEFSAQFKLFSQSINNALGMASTPERCDEQLSRLLVQLEELESQFVEHDEFLADIVSKREELYEAFEAHRQQLVDSRQRKAQSTSEAAERILSSVEKRSLKFSQEDELNTYFAADAMVAKIRELCDQLFALDASVQADDVDARLKAIRAQAVRSLRDKSDLFENDGNIIKFGPRHRFSVNTQELDLTIIPRQDGLAVHLTGTNYYEDIETPELLALKPVWDMTLVSESPDLYRGAYLAGEILRNANGSQSEVTLDALHGCIEDAGALAQLVRDYAAPRYREGYERGIHDHDAALLLKQLLPMLESGDLLRFDPASRGLAQVFWANIKGRDAGLGLDPGVTHQPVERRVHRSDTIGEPGNGRSPLKSWSERAQSASQLQSAFSSTSAVELLTEDIDHALAAFVEQHSFDVPAHTRRRAAQYLVAELGRERVEFITSKYAQRLVNELKQHLDDAVWRKHQRALKELDGWPAHRWELTTAWLQAMVADKDLADLQRFIPEAVALINVEQRLERRTTELDLQTSVSGLMGQHPTISNGVLALSLDHFLNQHDHHRDVVVADYERFLALRHEVISKERESLHLSEMRPRPLSSFVRNRLINETYLPIIGDNLAKQIGTVGADKRSDLMGLLMMISPPGYGKTTLMEYVASRLGLIFMKINCPSLGHDVLSLDPVQAPNATARQELDKINLSFEMGNNVMLYLDDIQHTNPEFLQKFISLCDGTRRIEGVWKGRSRTYDMRGRKFCVVMAGNPYTESGELFKIPDMLANRADIYNLGDILGGNEEQFALSYVENALTSNAVLAPLAMRDMNDVYRFVDRAQGKEVTTSDFSHHYSGAEANEITQVLHKMFAIRDVVLKINQQYIASAAQDDRYRVEPPFKLQGSYRNMNKMVEKVSAVMVDDELLQVIADHYLGEAQLLTTGAEANLLKLAELRGNMTAVQSARWEAIKQDFLRNKAMGGDDSEVGGRILVQLVDLVGSVNALKEAAVLASQPAQPPVSDKQVVAVLKGLGRIGHSLKESRPSVEVVNQPVPGMDKVLQTLADTIEHSFMPMVRHMDRKLEVDLDTHYKIEEVGDQIRKLRSQLAGKKPS